jgi:stearoyl-CoA desaturase (Delta-9 desaturase)
LIDTLNGMNEHGMSRLHRTVNLLVVVLPFVALVTAIVLLWNRVVGWWDLAILAAMYVLTGLGVTVGYHRMLTHRAFETYRWLRATFAVLGSMAVEGSAIRWVADHRKHHAFTDEEGDPHSPHVGRRPGVLGALLGLFHAHVGWLFTNVGEAEPERFAPDLVKERSMRVIDRTFFFWVGVGLLIPFGLGFLFSGRVTGALTALLWGGLVRVFVLHHVTWSINSVCHFFGRRRFDTDDESRNVFWLALPSFGEAWHHNHHAFPTSAFHGLRRSEALADPSGWVIRGLERLGLVWNVKRVSPERQRAKAVGAGA